MKKFIVFILLTVLTFTFSITNIYAQENDTDIIYSDKNLASPNLVDKEYLDDGWYQLYKTDVSDFRYNVYTGEWYMDGFLPGVGNNIIFLLDVLEDYVLTPVLISGTHNSQLDFQFYITGGSYLNLNSGQTRNISNAPSLQWPTNNINRIYNNAIIKFQLEKGNQATDYVVPLEPLIYHYTNNAPYGEGYNDGFDKGWQLGFNEAISMDNGRFVIFILIPIGLYLLFVIMAVWFKLPILNVGASVASLYMITNNKNLLLVILGVILLLFSLILAFFNNKESEEF